MISYSKRDELSLDCASFLARAIPLKKIYLFGSTAREDDRITSDIDICLIGPEELNRQNKETINEITADMYIESCITINWIYFSIGEWNKGILPLFKTIKREGRLLWEKEKIE